MDIDREEMEYVDGGKWYDAIITFFGGTATAVGLASILSGSSAYAISTMGVASLIACGPIGWGILGVSGVIAVATGAATVAAWKK